MALAPDPRDGSAFPPFLLLLFVLALLLTQCAPPRLVYRTPARRPAYMSYPILHVKKS
jgi:hypothetical protein